MTTTRAISNWQPLAETGDSSGGVRARSWPIQIKGRARAARCLGTSRQLARGVTEAQILLGAIYARGSGVPRDLVRAYAWLHRAAEKEGPNARLILDSVAGLMTAEEIEAAKALDTTAP